MASSERDRRMAFLIPRENDFLPLLPSTNLNKRRTQAMALQKEEKEFPNTYF
jgi:hypothetical protein